MKKLGLFYIILFFMVNFVPAVQVIPSDDFSSGLNTTLWTQYSTTNYTGYVSGGQHVTDAGGCGGVELRSNFYFTGDFDAQIDVYQINPSASSLILRFFKYMESGEPGLGDYGSLWGYAGQVYAWWPYSTASWCYSASGSASISVPSGQWYQLRVKRVDDDIYTYYKAKSSSTWTLQNSYVNIGTDAIYLGYLAGDGSSSGNSMTYADNFIATGYADTDPAGSIPEPSAIILVGLCIACVTIKKW